MLYDENLKPLCQPITKVKGTINIYAYDFDTIKLTGYTEERPKDAYVFRLNHDDGTEIYSGFVKKLTKKNNTIELIGRDLREWMDTAIIIDFDSPPDNMYALQLLTVLELLQSSDKVALTFGAQFNIALDFRGISFFGDMTDQIIYMSAWEYLLPYFKYYEYKIDKRFDLTEAQRGNVPLRITFSTSYDNYEIKLKDFAHELKQTDPETNKAIAVMENAEFGYEWVKQWRRYEWETTQTEWHFTTPNNTSTVRYIATGRTRTVYRMVEIFDDPAFGPTPTTNVLWHTSPIPPSHPRTNYYWHYTGDTSTQQEYERQERIEVWENVEPIETQWSETQPISDDPNYRWDKTGRHQPLVGAITYFYLTKDNMIAQGDQSGNYIDTGQTIPNRYYPVKAKIFKDQYLFNAQFQAILELCNNRWVDNIWLDSNDPKNPIDLSEVDIMNRFYIYTDDGFYKMLPVSEIELRITEKTLQKRIKLGFRKEKLTDIIRGL